jgi:hypothetical protein
MGVLHWLESSVNNIMSWSQGIYHISGKMSAVGRVVLKGNFQNPLTFIGVSYSNIDKTWIQEK